MKMLRIVFSFATLILLVACSSSSDEEQVLAVIDAAEKAAEERDVSDTMDLVADDYRDDRGLDKAQLRDFVRAYYFTHPRIELLVTTGEVEFPGNGIAQVRVDFVFVGTQTSGAGGAALAGDRESLQVELRRRGSEWKVMRVNRAHP
jgi:hypothetical protein